eukprot:scaffold69281_cov26-Tisochrysis_lutea.AAC.7
MLSEGDPARASGAARSSADFGGSSCRSTSAASRRSSVKRVTASKPSTTSVSSGCACSFHAANSAGERIFTCSPPFQMVMSAIRSSEMQKSALLPLRRPSRSSRSASRAAESRVERWERRKRRRECGVWWRDRAPTAAARSSAERRSTAAGSPGSDRWWA